LWFLRDERQEGRQIPEPQARASDGNCLVGVDIGASSCKAIVFDVDQKAKGRAQQEYSRSYPNPGWAELDASEWWNAVANTIRNAIEESGVPPENVKCLAVSAETDGILAVGKDGKPLRPYMHWLDTRCVKEHAWVRDHADLDHIYQVTGIPLQGSYDFPALKMLWIKRNEPNVYERTDKFLSIGTFILYKLTGKAVADRSTASRSLLFDVRRLEWSTEMAEFFGLPLEKQPDVQGSAEVAGTVTPEAAERTGLTVKTLAVTGGGDTECSALGAGVVSETQGLASIGTSLMVAVPQKKPSMIPKGRELFGTGAACTSHVVDKMWVLEVGCPVGGSMLTWFHQEFGQVESKAAADLGISAYELLSLEAEKSDPNPSSPIFAAPIGAILNLSYEHKRSDLIRSILEGVAYEAREVIEVFEESGLNIRNLTMVGGGAKSETWRQIMADITNKPVRAPHMQETGIRGATILAGIGAGLYEGFSAGEPESHSDSAPRKELQGVYTNLYEKYKRLYKSLQSQGVE
jgi:xylulokinase